MCTSAWLRTLFEGNRFCGWLERETERKSTTFPLRQTRAVLCTELQLKACVRLVSEHGQNLLRISYPPRISETPKMSGSSYQTYPTTSKITRAYPETYESNCPFSGCNPGIGEKKKQKQKKTRTLATKPFILPTEESRADMADAQADKCWLSLRTPSLSTRKASWKRSSPFWLRRILTGS